MRIYSFQKLRVYQLALDVAQAVYELTENFPADELYGVRSQVRRSAASVAANIAEGSGAFSGKEQARFTVMAFRSLLETIQHIELAERLKYVTHAERVNISAGFDKLANLLNAYRKSQLLRDRNSKTAKEAQAPYGHTATTTDSQSENYLDFPEFWTSDDSAN